MKHYGYRAFFLRFWVLACLAGLSSLPGLGLLSCFATSYSSITVIITMQNAQAWPNTGCGYNYINICFGNSGCYFNIDANPAVGHFVGGVFTSSGNATGNGGEIWISQPAGCQTGPAKRTASQFATANGQTLNFNWDWTGSGTNMGAPPQTNCVTVTVNNNSDYCKSYSLKFISSWVPLGNTVQVPARGSHTFTECYVGERSPVTVGVRDDCNAAYTDFLMTETPEGAAYGTNGIPQTAPSTLGDGGATPGHASTNLSFSGAGSAGSARDSTLQEGFSAIRDAMVEGFNRDRANQDTANTALKAIQAGQANQATAANQVTAQTTQTAIKTDTGNIAANTGTSATKLGSIDTSLADIRTAVQAANTGQATAANQVTAQTSLMGIKATLDAINVATSPNAANLSTIAGAANNIQAKVANLDDIKSMTYNIQQSLGSGVGNDLSGISTKLTDLNTKSTTANGLLTDLNTKEAAGNGIGTQGNFYMSNILGQLGTMDTHAGQTGSGLEDKFDEVMSRQDMQIADFRAYTNALLRGPGTYDVNDNAAAGQIAGDAIKASYDAFRDSIVQPTPGAAPSSGGSVFDIVIGSIGAGGLASGGSKIAGIPGQWTVHTNPMENGGLNNVVVAFRQGFSWVATAAFFILCLKASKEYEIALTHVGQARAMRLDFVGNSIGAVTGLPIAIIMTAAVATLPTAMIALLTTYFGGTSFLGGSPFQGFGAISGVLYLIWSCFPVDLLLLNLAFYITFRLTIGAVYQVAATIIRFCFT